MANERNYIAEIQEINSTVSQYFASIGQSQDYYEKPSNNVNALQGQLDDKRTGVGNSDTSITATIIADQQTELDRKLAEVEMLKDQLTIMDVKIDRFDALIQNIDKEIIPLIDEINVAITSVKTAYDTRVSAGCSSDLYWEQIGTKQYDWFGFSFYDTIYQCKKNPNVRRDYGYYGAKYYRKPQNQDYGANIVKEFLGTISVGSASLAILDNGGTSNLQVGDTITDNVDNPTVFSSANLPSIVGFGTTAIVASSTQFSGLISVGSTIIASTGIGTTGNVNVGDTISLSGVLALNTTVAGIGTTTTTQTVWNPNYGGAGIGSMISTSVSVKSLIVSVAAIGSTTNGTFTVGILSTFPSVILSGVSIKAATNTNFTDIRTTQTDATTFDYSNNPIDPVTIGIIGNDTLGLGHKIVKINNGSPVGPFQWKSVMTSSFEDKTDAQLNDNERYLRATYPEPLCGASYARYYTGNNSWPVKNTFTYSFSGHPASSTSTTYAQEGDVVTVGFGFTTPFGIGYASVSSINPSSGTCNPLSAAITAAETNRDAIIARNTPKIDSLVASASALRGIRDKMEGQAFAVLQGRVYGDVEINKLKTELAALRATDLKQFEPQTYYFNPDTGKTSSSTVGVENLTSSNGLVVSGLVLNLDAGNPQSYSGSGTNWNDISGNGNNGILINGPTYSSANIGSIVFDGVNDYADIPIPLAASYSTVTIEGFIKLNSFNGGMFLGFTTYDVWTSGNTLGYNNGAGNVIGIDALTVTSLGLLGNYKHYTFVMNSSGLLSTNKIYINGISQSISAVVNADGNIPGLASNLRLASWNNGAYYGNVQYGNLKVYNRELTASEITQNFNALRGRFGL
jgi:hypothetical protein